MPNTGPQRHRYWWDVLLNHLVNTISCTKTSQFMRFREIIAVCSQIHTKHVNTLCGQNVDLLKVKLVVRIVTAGLWRDYVSYTYRFSSYRAVNSISRIYELMLYREIIGVCSQIHTKHMNTLCGQNVEMLNVKLVVHIVTTGLWRGTFHSVYRCLGNKHVLNTSTDRTQ